MRNGWKATRCAVVAAFSAWVSSPTLAAQQAPTVESVQKFLAAQLPTVATQVRFVDSAGRANYVTGKYSGEVKTIKGGLRKTKETIEALPERPIDKQLTDVRVTHLDAIDAYARPNQCATRITQVVAPDYDEIKSSNGDDSRAFSFTLTYTNEVWKYEPLTRFMNPAQVIDWSDVKINRSPEHYLTVTAKGQAFPSIQLTYFPLNADLADQIEFAMRFLAMSCGAGARALF